MYYGLDVYTVYYKYMIENLSLEILIDSKLARKRLKNSEKKVKKMRSCFTNLFQYWITDKGQIIFARYNFQSKNRPVTDLWHRKWQIIKGPGFTGWKHTCYDVDEQQNTRWFSHSVLQKENIIVPNLQYKQKTDEFASPSSTQTLLQICYGLVSQSL